MVFLIPEASYKILLQRGCDYCGNHTELAAEVLVNEGEEDVGVAEHQISVCADCYQLEIQRRRQKQTLSLAIHEG